MIKLTALAAALTLSFLVAPVSKADTYSINFITIYPYATVPAPTGFFTYNAGTFSNFFVAYDGFNFDLTAQANTGFMPLTSGTGGSIPVDCQFISTFQYLSSRGSCAPNTYFVGTRNDSQGPYEEFSFAVPLVGGVIPSVGVADVVLTLPLAADPQHADGTFFITDITAATPEPSSLLLLATGLAGCATHTLRRLRRKT